MSRRQGFTLIELVVVILILGILAGVAAPKMFSTSAKATDNGLKQSLNIIRDAIELYYSQNGAYPPCAATPGADFKSALTPFVRGQFPKCPVGPAQNANVLPTSGASTTGIAAPTDGWKFNTTTGVFICGYSGATTTDATVTYDAL